MSSTLSHKDAFSWKRRYAVHRSFHSSHGNQIAHFIGTPIQLFSFIKFFSLIHLNNTPFGVSCNASLIFIAFLTFVYCRIHLFVGFLVSGYLILCWAAACTLLWSSVWYVNLLIALAAFGLGVFIQVGVGHKVLQKEETNLGTEFTEFFQTRDPMIFVLIFFFPFLDFYKIYFCKTTNAKEQITKI